jgi:hypothetical protein
VLSGAVYATGRGAQRFHRATIGGRQWVGAVARCMEFPEWCVSGGMRVPAQAARSTGTLGAGGSASVCQPSTLRIVIWPEATSAQNSMAAVSAEGSMVWVLMRRLNSSCSRSIALVVRADFHWLGGRRRKVNRRSPASSRLVATAGQRSRHLRRNARRLLSTSFALWAYDLPRHPGVAGQRGAAPLLCAPALVPHSRAWHADPHRAERAEKPPLAGSVPVALRLRRPLVPAAAQGLRQLLLQQLLDEPAHPGADSRLDRVKPGLSRERPHAVRLRRRAILFHGVVSAGARTPVWLVATNRRLRRQTIPPPLRQHRAPTGRGRPSGAPRKPTHCPDSRVRYMTDCGGREGAQ